jgi:hypothetical protein
MAVQAARPQPQGSLRWEQLGQALKRRRIDLGFGTQRGFVMASGAGRLGERMIRKIENGETGRHEPDTIIRIEQMYRLAPRAVTAYLSGEASILAAAPGAERHHPPVSDVLAAIPPAVLGRALLRAVREAEAEELPGSGRAAAG